MTAVSLTSKKSAGWSCRVLAIVCMTLACSPAWGDDAEFAAAEKLFRAAKYKEAAAKLEPLVEHTPQNAKYHYLLGEALFFQDKFSEAALEFKAAMNLEPGQGAYSGRAAEAFFAAGRKDDAVAVCEKGALAVTDPAYLKLLQTIKTMCTTNAKVKIRTSENNEDRGGTHGANR